MLKRFAILVVAVATVSAAWGQVSIALEGSAPNSPDARSMQAFWHAPMRRAGVAPLVSNGTAQSYNWSGYAVTGTGFTDAKGSWTVPAVNCAVSPNAWAMFWVGLDGYSDSTVEQTGTGVWCDRKTPVYYAWYEFYPNPSQVISSMTVTPGDTMSAEVSYASSEFTVTLTDETTGASYTTTQAVAGAGRSSAEWIAEAPEAVTGILNLADFGKVHFGDDYTSVTGTNQATDSTVSGVIKKFGTAVEKITQVDDTNFKEASPSALSTDGSSFTSNWIEYN